jgi:sporulation protein YlmC with PRC-barrel domain
MRPPPIVPTAAALAVAALLTAGPRPVLSQAVQLVVVDVQTVEQGYRTSKLKGTNVVNDQNEKIGTLDDVIIGRDGNALFAVLQVGGFLGLGGRLVAVPYQNLDVSDDGRRIVLPGATKEALKNLPEFKYA